MTNPYFVDITTEKSPFECYQKIKTAAENDSSAITPELCLDILQSTNYPPVISAMVKRAAFAIEGDTRRYLNFAGFCSEQWRSARVARKHAGLCAP